LISVIIPTYYRNERLRAAIESVRNQTYDNVEIIVVDGSDDGRATAVAEECGTRYIHQGEDGGAHVARSMGAEAAEGDYVNFLDDDDRMEPRKLEKQLPVLEADDEIGVVYCGIRWENGHPVLPDPEVQGDVLEQALMFHMTPSSPSTMLIDGAVLRDILPLRNRHGADDMGMKIELAQRCEFDFVDEQLVIKGDDDESLGGSRANIKGRLELLEKYEPLYEEYPDRVHRVALGHTYLLDAEIELNRSFWSPRAIKQSLLACYHIPGYPLPFVGFLCASLLGRPGRALGGWLYSTMVLGSDHRGKMTTPK
jgi:glycosyltransferase involved in cell wall biosynthesis